MKTIRFSLADFLWAVCLIGSGIGAIGAVLGTVRKPEPTAAQVAVWFVAWTLLGAGIGVAFRSKVFGGIVGLTVLSPTTAFILVAFANR